MNNKQAQSQIISSRNHVTIKRIRALRDREERDRTGLFYGEGVRFLVEAVKHNAQIEMLVICPPLVLNVATRMLISKLRRAGTPIIEVTPEVLHSIAQIDDPQGVGAVVRQKWRTLDEVKLDGRLCWVALESVQSPGNLGSMVRTASAVGAAGFIFLSESVDVYDPASVRAGMGAIFAQRFVRTTPQELAEWKVPRQWRLIGTSPNGETDYRKRGLHVRSCDHHAWKRKKGVVARIAGYVRYGGQYTDVGKDGLAQHLGGGGGGVVRGVLPEASDGGRYMTQDDTVI